MFTEAMSELLHGLAMFALYVIPAAGIMFTARRFVKIPDELFRKILHFILLGAYFPFLFAFDTWWVSAGCAAGLVLLLYPVLALAGRIPGFTAFTTERKQGEFKSSMALAIGMIALSITVCWGIFGDKLLVAAAFVLLVSDGRMSAVSTIIILSREFIISGFRLIAADKKVVMAAGWLGKIKTVTQIIAIILLMLNNFPFHYIGIPMDHIMEAVCVIFTIWSGTDYIVKNRSVLLDKE